MEELTRELNEIQTDLNLRCDYLKTMALLRSLKAGVVTMDNVTMTDDGWSLAEVEETEEPPDEGE